MTPGKVSGLWMVGIKKKCLRNKDFLIHEKNYKWKKLFLLLL